MSPIIREPQSSTSRGSAGVQFIPITTPVGTFKVWTRKVGDNAHVKILLLHGGPAFTTEYFESFEPYLVDDKGYELYYYHQLGSYLSDQPGTEHDDTLWTPHRFVEEVEQVRKGLGINSENGYFVGNS
ncbi:hypothetical protein SARC_05184 [Sphaeroforma arctica JP610]|uniref:AB hydrolase-1 domain-containing protein n=1 Tax=Sphaeroforma arctica JP610 TaxID=667725 RepID=A0A0L0G143_9EUKA|nr:hypothetical protein SARC_05184 [Sphaeroforma arctica JP610]KNC82536.1 hypothetical protein SARC_05184 [Sphaeroforma arctica JP610]|eukprot:XP_014156438.1 hypothetical protein SARC_05184 [Sphaeroforma arctica JP610]